MISEGEDCKLVVQMGSKEALKVRKDEGAAKLCKDAVKKHSDRDQFSIIPRSEGGRKNAMQSK